MDQREPKWTVFVKFVLWIFTKTWQHSRAWLISETITNNLHN
jgi:hypothetical protein